MSQSNYGIGRKKKSEELFQKFRQNARHGELHALNVIDDGGRQRAGRMFLKECRGPFKDKFVQIVSEAGGRPTAANNDEPAINWNR